MSKTVPLPRNGSPYSCTKSSRIFPSDSGLLWAGGNAFANFQSTESHFPRINRDYLLILWASVCVASFAATHLSMTGSSRCFNIARKRIPSAN
jgi:hypothetical protein